MGSGAGCTEKVMRSFQNHRKVRSGFTLIELAVVAVIVSILATYLLGRIFDYQEKAEKVAMQQMVGTLRSALHLKIGDVLIRGNESAVAQLANITLPSLI